MFCACGCGERTRPSDRTDPARGVKKGEPLNYISGHGRRGRRMPPRYVVTDSSCWEWTGPIATTGYGMWSGELAHRAMWTALHGPITDGLQLDHLCRNRACCNPDHLQVVTNAENTRRGERTKLTWDDGEAIRASDESHAATARRFGVHPAHVSRIRNRRRWSVA